MVLFLLISGILNTSIDSNTLEWRIKNILAGEDAVYGIAFHRLDRGTGFTINGDDQMHAASTMKVPVMMRLFEMIDAGQLTMSKPIPVRNSFKSIIDGSPYRITVDQGEQLYEKLGQTETVERLIYWMVAHSSNLATNILIELAGAEKVMGLMDRLSIKGVLVLRGVEDIKAYEAGKSNRATAAGMQNAMRALAESKLFSKESRVGMIEILRQQVYAEMIPAGIPKDSGSLIAHKTGTISTVEHDTAIVDLPDGRRYVLTIFSRDFSGEEGRKQVWATAARISKMVYDHMMANP